MKTVVNVSIGGRSFSLDDDAYARLSSYFDHFKAGLGKDSFLAADEVMSDLESRIAELFFQSTGDSTNRVVDLNLVNKVVTQIGMPDGSPEPVEGAGPGRASWTAEPVAKRLFRDPDNKAISGVCSGLAAYLDCDVTLVRIITLLTVLLWGTGLVVYLVLWIVVPLAKTPAQKCEMRGIEPNAVNMARFKAYSR